MREQDQTFTPEHIQIVRWTASLGAITAEAFAQRIGVSVRSARGKLVAAQQRKLLSRHRPLSGRPALFTATRAGLRACNARGLKVCEVRDSNANHLIVCAATAAALERCYPLYRIVGERELRRDEREQGRPLASARLGRPRGSESALHRPDLVLWPTASEEELPVVVEVELTIKAHLRLVEICRAWARCRTIAGVLYFAPEDVRRALLRAVAEARASEQVIVMPLDSLPRPDASVEPRRFGPSNQAETHFWADRAENRPKRCLP